MNDGIVVEVDLLSGRYHAHVWGQSQFGMAGPEWPPSPWRLLRALAAVWFATRPSPFSEQDRDHLLEVLGRADPPELWLPKTSFHEVRYYQPVRMAGSDRALHHDFFAVPDGGRFWFRFNVGLTADQRNLLEALLTRFRYLGRSESRARLRLVDRGEPPHGVVRVVPRRPGQSVTSVTYRWVLCTAPDFRAADLWSVGNGSTKTGGGAHPPHLVDLLLDKKMPLPNGARWVEYAVPDGILIHEIRPRAKPPAGKPDVEVAELHFRLNRRIPIPVQSLVGVARAFRDTAAARHRNLTGIDSRVLTGREADGSIARGHQHAYYLPRPSGTRLAVDTLVVRIPAGRLTSQELDALLGVTQIRIGKGPYPITVIPERRLDRPLAPRRATCWRSMTPFVPPLRHRPGRDRTSVEEQAAFFAEQLCGRRPVSVRRRPGPGGLGEVSPLLVHQYFGHDREKGTRRPILTRRLGFWLELAFDKPVVVSAPLGADAHFGAGQFEPAETEP